MHYLYCLILAIFVAGCAPTISDLRKDLDRGVGGYLGPVTRFSVAQPLRYEPFPEVSQWITVLGGTSRGDKTHMEMTWRARMSAIGAQRFWEWSVDEITEDGKHYKASNIPLFVVRALSSPRGPITDVDVDSPILRQQGKALDRQSDLYRKMVDQMQGSGLVFPEAPVVVGDTLATADVLMRRALGQDILAKIRPDLIRTNTIALRVAGETFQDGRRLLVAVLDGSFEAMEGHTKIEFAAKGHWLIEATTGLAWSGAMIVDLRVQSDDQTTSLEAIARFGSRT